MHLCCRKRKRNRHAEILFCDLDNTLLGDDNQSEQMFIREWPKYQKEFKAMLVYNTGRPLSKVLEWIDAERLPPVEFVICGQGLNIYYNKELWQPWLKHMENTKFQLQVLNEMETKLAKMHTKMIIDNGGKCEIQIDRKHFMLRFFVISQDWDLCKKQTKTCTKTGRQTPNR